jgi:hypothetical protein
VAGVGVELQLRRYDSTPDRTIGHLYVAGVFVGFTCEDAIRDGEKVYGKTAIPPSRYRITITHSKRFDRDLPLVNDVPGFAGIRIHPGNTAADTEGCILPGLHRDKDAVRDSRAAFVTIFAMIETALKLNQEVWIDIQNPETPNG